MWDMKLPEVVEDIPLRSLKSSLELERCSSQRSVTALQVVFSSILAKYADTSGNLATLLRLVHPK